MNPDQYLKEVERSLGRGLTFEEQKWALAYGKVGVEPRVVAWVLKDTA